MTKAYDVPRHHAILYKENVKADPCPNDPGFAAEVYHRLYSESPNAIPLQDGNATRHALHSLIDELPEFDTLRHLTTRDPLWAGMAANTLGAKVAPNVPKTANVKSAEDILAGLQMMQAELPDSEKIDNAITRAREDLRDATALDAVLASKLDESAIRNALRQAIGQATTEIQDAESALSLLGYGQGKGTSTGTTNPGVALELARRVKSSKTLSDIIALAGKLTRTARAKRAARTDYARSEVVGVEQTGHVERLLGSEMALLNDPDMADDLMIRLFENKALGYKMTGKEKLAKGPIVLVLDQSGSMSSENKDIWSKAIALAIYDTARQDNRGFAVVLYSDGVDAYKEIKTPADMLDMLAHYPNGGTSYDAAMIQALSMAKDKSDIIHISDGQAPTDTAAACLAAADKLHCRIYGIGIGHVGSALAAWSNECTVISDVNRDTAAVDLLFSDGGI